MLKKYLQIEFNKLRASKVFIVALLGSVVTSVLATYSLWQSSLSNVDGFSYASVLLSEAFFSALIWPVVASGVASRQAEIEYQHRGWILNAMSGLRIIDMIRAKVILGSFSLLLAIIVQLGLTTLICKFNGLQGSQSGWLLYHFLLWVVLTLFYMFFTLVSCSFEKQIFVLVAGVVSAFISVFCFISSLKFNYLLPWAYFSMIVPFKQSNMTVVPNEIDIFPILAFICLSLGGWKILAQRIRIWR